MDSRLQGSLSSVKACGRPAGNLLRGIFCVCVAGLRWSLCGLGTGRPEVSVRISGSVVVRPLGFWASALFADTLYPIANLRAVIERHAVLNASLVIINEEA